MATYSASTDRVALYLKVKCIIVTKVHVNCIDGEGKFGKCRACVQLVEG